MVARFRVALDAEQPDPNGTGKNDSEMSQDDCILTQRGSVFR